MAMNQTSYSNAYESSSIELHKMKHELLMFVTKMKSEGYLTTVDYHDLPDVFETDRVKSSVV